PDLLELPRDPARRAVVTPSETMNQQATRRDVDDLTVELMTLRAMEDEGRTLGPRRFHGQSEEEFRCLTRIRDRTPHRVRRRDDVRRGRPGHHDGVLLPVRHRYVSVRHNDNVGLSSRWTGPTNHPIGAPCSASAG